MDSFVSLIEIKPMLIRLDTYIVHDSRMSPVYFKVIGEGRGQM